MGVKFLFFINSYLITEEPEVSNLHCEKNIASSFKKYGCFMSNRKNKLVQVPTVPTKGGEKLNLPNIFNFINRYFKTE